MWLWARRCSCPSGRVSGGWVAGRGCNGVGNEGGGHALGEEERRSACCACRAV